jgi:hypothetical protein
MPVEDGPIGSGRGVDRLALGECAGAVDMRNEWTAAPYTVDEIL